MAKKKKRRGVAKNCGKGATRQLKEANSTQSWYRQAFLMNFVHPLVGPLQYKTGPTDAPGADASKYIKKIIAPGKTESVVNLLTTNPSVMAFFDGRPLDYGQLVPYIKLYKVYIRNKKEVKEVLFPFMATTDFDQWSAMAGIPDTLFRGRDAGIQDVRIQMDGRGRNPVSANVMHLTIKYFFNDVKTLFAPLAVDPFAINRGGNPPFVTYSDLIRYPPSLEGIENAASSAASFRIRLCVGWSINDKNLVVNKGFKEAAQNASINFIGDLYAHNLDFREDGSIIVTAKYKGALETAFASTSADILSDLNIDNSEDLRGLEIKLNRIEETQWNAAIKQIKSGGSKRSMQSMSTTLKSLNMLIAARKALTKILNKEPFPKGPEAKLNIALSSFKGSMSKIHGGAGFNKLKKAAQGLGAAKTYTKNSGTKNFEKRTKTALQKKLREQMGKEKGGRKLYNKMISDIQKEQKAVKAQIRSLKNSIEAKYLFEFLFDMMDRDMVAYVPTDKASAFGAYTKLRNFYDTGQYTEDKAMEKAKTLTKLLQKQGVAKTSERTEATVNASDPTGDPATMWKRPPRTHEMKKGTAQLIRTGGKNYKHGDKIFFFRLGDLLSTIFDKGKFGEKIENIAPNFRVLLGDYYTYDINTTGPGHTMSTSLYDLPISLDIFNAFVSQKIVGTGRKQYPLMAFIWDLIKFIMDKTMGSFGKSAQGTAAALITPINFKLDMTAIDLPADKLSDSSKAEITLRSHELDKVQTAQRTTRNGPTSLNTLEISHPVKLTPINRVSNTFLFHAHGGRFNERIRQERRADRMEDRKDGIFHFHVGGPSRGLLKNIKFIENSNTLFSTAMMRNGQNGGIDAGTGVIKPSKFNCEMTLVGNPYFFIGQMFYVNTELITSGLFRKENIMNGGYYIVTSVESHFSPSGWETIVKGVLNIPDINLDPSHKHKPIQKLRSFSNESKAALGEKARAAHNTGLDQATKPATEVATPTKSNCQPQSSDPTACGFKFAPAKKPAHGKGTQIVLSKEALDEHMKKGGTPGAKLMWKDNGKTPYLQYT